MKNKHSYIAAFDLDKTLLSVNSSRLVVKMSRSFGLMKRREYNQAIFYSLVYKFDLKNPNEILLSMMQWIKGLKEKEVIYLAGKHIVPEMQKNIRQEMVSALEFHRSNNARLVLLSSALPYFCNPIAEYLGMDDVVCSRLEVNNGYFTGNPINKLVFGEEKAARMKAYCHVNNFSLTSTWYYGDAYSDRFILQSVGHPVCVKPEIKLGWLAKKKGWKII